MQSPNQSEHDEFKDYANWYVRYNIAQQEHRDRKYKFILGEYNAESAKRKHLEQELETKQKQIATLNNENKRLKSDTEEAVKRENVLSRKCKDLLDEMKHHKSSKQCFVKHCEHAPTARFKSLSFCSFACAEKTFTVKAIDLKPI